MTEKGLIACRLLDSVDKAYGLDLVKRSGGKLKKGTVYVVLEQLAGDGLIESEQEYDPTRAGKPRRFWWLTESGKTVLHARCYYESVLREALAGSAA